MTAQAEYRRISIVAHGAWGTGKSWFADTTPGPRLIVDAEGGTEDTASNKISWDDFINNASLGLSADDSVVVDVTEWSQLADVMTLLNSGGHPFESVVFDSLTEIQKVLKDSISDGPDAIFDQQKWGKLLGSMELMVRQLRNLTRKSAARRVNVVIVLGTDSESGKNRFLIQGGLRKTLGGFPDVVGFLFVGKNGAGEDVRVMRVLPDEATEAKCRIHKLSTKFGKDIVNPTMPKILSAVNS